VGKIADDYIRRATWKLLGKARLDRAAELRTHLLERTNKFMLEGFSPDEAEFLAVEQMGEPMGPLPNPFKFKRRTLVAASGIVVLLATSIVGFSHFQKGDIIYSLEYPEYAHNQTLEMQLYNGISFSQSVGAVFSEQNAEVRLPNTAQQLFFQTVGPDTISEIQSAPVVFVSPSNSHHAKLAMLEFQLDKVQNLFNVTVGVGAEKEVLTVPQVGHNDGGFLLEPKAYVAKWTPSEPPSIPLNRWTPVAVFGAKDQTVKGGEDATILYVLASDQSASRTADILQTHTDDLPSILERHEQHKYGDVLSYRKL